MFAYINIKKRSMKMNDNNKIDTSCKIDIHMYINISIYVYVYMRQLRFHQRYAHTNIYMYA